MPRKAPDNVTEHRITFGNKEREIIQETANKIAVSNTIGAVGSAIGGISMGGLAIAALIYAGFKLDDWIDDWSTELSTWLMKQGYVVYHAEYYLLKIKEAEAEIEALMEQVAAGAITYEAFSKRFAILSKRIKVLTSLIADIAEGRRPGYGVAWSDAQHAAIIEAVYDDEWRHTEDTSKYTDVDDDIT